MDATCQVCGTTFHTTPSRIKDGKGKYCSAKCYQSVYRPAHNRKEPVLRTCRNCGKEFSVRASHATKDRGQFCSVACNLTVQHAAAKTPLESRYWSKVVKTDGCWQWDAAKNRFGYGVLNIGREQGITLAHRLSWEIHFGPIPENLYVLHKCDNPQCTRPDHLFLGTYADNARDAMQKGRTKGGKPKLTWEQVQEIRQRFAAGGISQAELARQYGVSDGNICNLVNFKSYKHPPVNP